MLLHPSFCFEADSKVKPAKALKLLRYIFYTNLPNWRFEHYYLAVKLFFARNADLHLCYPWPVSGEVLHVKPSYRCFACLRCFANLQLRCLASLRCFACLRCFAYLRCFACLRCFAYLRCFAHLRCLASLRCLACLRCFAYLRYFASLRCFSLLEVL